MINSNCAGETSPLYYISDLICSIAIVFFHCFLVITVHLALMKFSQESHKETVT